MCAALVACSSGTAEPSPTIGQPATTTTTAPTVTTSTTAAPAGDTITRATALALNRCLDGWYSVRFSAAAGVVFLDEFDAFRADCEEAQRQLDVDRIGVPPGDSPVNTVGLVLATIAVQAGFANLDLLANDSCSGGACDLSPDVAAKFMALDGVPAPFAGRELVRVSVESFEGLRVEG